MKKNCIFFLIVLLVFTACNNGQDTEEDEFSVPDSVLNEAPKDFAQESLNQVIENIASPVEMATIIKNAKAEFQKKSLCNTDYIDLYETGLEQSLALGAFGADLGYINIYGKTTLVLNYIMGLKELADQIKVGQFFDFSTLKRLALHSNNIDSLTYISVHSFNEIDTYLRENDRGNYSALMIAGSWLEGLYLATQIIKEKPNNEIAEKIGEQKIILNDLMLILQNYNNNAYFNNVIKSFNKIKKELDKVEITYEKGEPKSVEKDGMLIIVQNETSIINMSDKQLKNIIKTTEDIRNELLVRKETNK